jgi:hypothetical protein
MDNAKILEQVNERLKRGEGWVGYRYSKGSNGEKLPSKFLYFAFYQGSQQRVVNSKTKDPEEAYRQLLDARRATTEGVRLLPSEVSRIRYEDPRVFYWIITANTNPARLRNAIRKRPIATEITSPKKSLLAPINSTSFMVLKREHIQV